MTKLKTRTPECDKMLEIREFSQKVGEFLDWLKHDQKIIFCRPNYNSARPDTIYEPVHHILPTNEEGVAHKLMDDPPSVSATTENLLAAFFEIDLDKVEEEKQAMLEELRRKS